MFAGQNSREGRQPRREQKHSMSYSLHIAAVAILTAKSLVTAVLKCLLAMASTLSLLGLRAAGMHVAVHKPSRNCAILLPVARCDYNGMSVCAPVLSRLTQVFFEFILLLRPLSSDEQGTYQIRANIKQTTRQLSNNLQGDTTTHRTAHKVHVNSIMQPLNLCTNKGLPEQYIA